MLRKIFSIFSLFIIPAVVLMTPLLAQSDPADSGRGRAYESWP